MSLNFRFYPLQVERERRGALYISDGSMNYDSFLGMWASSGFLG